MIGGVVELSGSSLQAYRALSIAAERIGLNNYRAGRAREGKRYRYIPTPEHMAVVQAMSDLAAGRITPDDAMGLLHDYDVMKQRVRIGGMLWELIV